jgi:hypothetical protein
MSNSIFIEKSKKPSRSKLTEALGGSSSFWEDIKSFIEENIGEFIEEWKFYSKKSGWTLKLLRKKRNLFFFIPQKGQFKITFVFGDKAVSAIKKSDLPKGIINDLLNARKYMEGRGLQINVTSPADVENIKKLLRIKTDN